MIIRYKIVLGGAVVLTLSGCSMFSVPPPASQPYEPYQVSNQGTEPHYHSDHGVVSAIKETQADYQGIAGTGFGLGTVAGAVIGGVVGNQVGGGSGKTAATIAGSAGGAYVGHQIEKNNQPAPGYSITVRMNNGSYQTVTQATIDGLHVGDSVRLDHGTLQRY